MEFDKTPRFWCPCVALAAYINFAFGPDENLRSDFRKSEKETKKEIKNFKILSLHAFCLSAEKKFPLMMLFFNRTGLEHTGVVGHEIGLLLDWSAGSGCGIAGLQFLNVALHCKDKRKRKK